MPVMLLLLAGLLATASLPANAGIVSTDTYQCDPTTCLAPTCQCASNSAPGGLLPTQIPQFVLISHENALNELSVPLMMRLIGNKNQSNGCPVPVTWFTQTFNNRGGANPKTPHCDQMLTVLDRGHELAVQATLFEGSATGQPSLESQITMSRDLWHASCGITKKDIIGFRAQGYVNNPTMRQALSDQGWLYDSNLPEWWYPNSPTSPAADQQMLWPYTMDSGIPQDCGYFGPDVGSCAPGERYPGLWEVPLQVLQDNQTTVYGAMNYGSVETGQPAVDDMFELFKRQLDERRAGGRAPLQINTYYEWLSQLIPGAPDCIYCLRDPSPNALALARFVDYATALPDVHFITFSDLIRWTQYPEPLEEIDAWTDCMTLGVKANLTGVNLPAMDKAAPDWM